MASRRLTAGFALPFAALLGVTTALGWLLPRPGYYADKGLLAIAALLLVAALWQRTRRTNLALARFLAAIAQGDLTQGFRAVGQGAGFDALGAALDDVLRRLRAERLAAASDNRFADALVDEVPTPLLAIDEAGTVHLANKAARRLFREADGRPVDRFARYGDAFADALATIAAGRRRVCPVLWNGLSQRALVTAATVDREGRPWRIVSVNIIQDELETAELATQTDLVRVLTHEIMNSLTPVTSLAASAAGLIAEAQDGSPEAIADARLAIETLARRAASVTHFVDTYRDFGHTPAVAVARFAARPWIDELARSFQAMPQGRDVALTVAVVPAGLHIDGDAVLLGQVVLNLLKNAGEAASRVAVTIADTDAGRVRIAVEDDGPGIAAGLESEIFLPFFTTRASGTGVGLSFARQIVLLHHGSIGVGAAAAGGARFDIVL